MALDPQQLLETFLDEADEHLTTLEQGLVHLSEDAGAERLNAIFRAAHSIKGGSGLFGFSTVTRLTHAFEQLLDRLRKGSLPTTPSRIDLLLRTTDELKALMSVARSGLTTPPVPEALIAELEEAAGVRPPQQPNLQLANDRSSGADRYRIVFQPHDSLLADGLDPLLLLRNLGKRCTFQSVKVHTEAIPTLDQIDESRAYLWWEIEATAPNGIESLRDVFLFVEEQCTIEIRPIDAIRTGSESIPTIELIRHVSHAIEELMGWATTTLPIIKRELAGTDAFA